MLMAQEVGIATVPFGLVKLKSGEISYITRRIDRDDRGKKLQWKICVNYPKD